jgi:hypothetical protein
MPGSLPSLEDPVRDDRGGKLRLRQLTDDGNVEITGRDLRERTSPVGQANCSRRLWYGDETD